jgi:epoxide hydrolase-like protein
VRDHTEEEQKSDTTSTPTHTTAKDPTIRPFRVDIPDEALDDLRRRIAATRWPSRKLVTDRSQGVQLATIQELARHWAADYDWRRCEAKLNALPQFTTEIDGVDIHFLHVSRRCLAGSAFSAAFRGTRPKRTASRNARCTIACTLTTVAGANPRPSSSHFPRSGWPPTPAAEPDPDAGQDVSLNVHAVRTQGRCRTVEAVPGRFAVRRSKECARLLAAATHCRLGAYCGERTSHDCHRQRCILHACMNVLGRPLRLLLFLPSTGAPGA